MKQNGLSEAVLEFLADDGIIFPEHGDPVMGIERCSNVLEGTGIKVASIVKMGEKASSNDGLRCFWGKYTNAENKDSYYLSVWMKVDSRWRFRLLWG